MSADKKIIENVPVTKPIILVMGHTGHGTSSFVKSLLSPEDQSRIQIGHGCLSCTSRSTSWRITLGHRTVQLVETPGLNHTNFTDTSLLLSILTNISACQVLSAKIKGIIFLLDITSKIGNTTLHHLELLRALVGPKAYKNLVFATTKWRPGIDTEEEHHTKQVRQDSLMTSVLSEFVLTGKAELHSFLGNLASARTITTSLVGKPNIAFQIEDELRNKSLRLWDTEVVRTLRKRDPLLLQKPLENALGATMQELCENQTRFVENAISQRESRPRFLGSLQAGRKREALAEVLGMSVETRLRVVGLTADIMQMVAFI
ncbi:MAG: hypothetical protein M1839_003597 [Geoglossum umbratile]|nr:MAG: hypothetical protein M1839_003597 [Geoglossum umbratile]